MGRFFGATCRREIAGGLLLSENHYQPAQSTPIHHHEVALFYFVLEGNCREQAEHTEAVHPPSTLVYLPAGAEHATRWSAESQGRCFHLELTQTFPSERVPQQSAVFSRGATPTLMQRLYTEFQCWDSYSPLIAEGIALELLGTLGRQQSSAQPSRESWLSTVEQCLRANTQSPPSLTQLAQLVDIHPSHLVRAFRKRFHTTPGEFVRQLRIEQACQRLRQEPQLSLTELALELGFADQSHFSRTFRKQLGVSPDAYRRRQ